MDIIKSLKEKKPVYQTKYKDELVLKFTPKLGGTDGSISHEEMAQSGKFFRNQYEFYIYAAFLGLKNDKYRPFDRNEKECSTFEIIKNWKHDEITDYLLMCVIAKTKTDWTSIDPQKEESINNFNNDVIATLEAYANGGMELLLNQFKTNKLAFESDHCFIDFLWDGLDFFE